MPMDSAYDTHRWVGCPIRISTDQRLLAAPRGFSQRATSFIASWCQGIHRMPFSYSIHIPRTRRGTPCTETILRSQRPTSGTSPHQAATPIRHAPRRSASAVSSIAHITDPCQLRPQPRSREAGSLQPTRVFTHASEPSPPTAGAPPLRTALPVRHTAKRRDQRPIQADPPRPHASRDAPEPDLP